MVVFASIVTWRDNNYFMAKIIIWKVLAALSSVFLTRSVVKIMYSSITKNLRIGFN